ncbi:hypothetical protein SAMN05216548_1145 [Faunimonas pinastri]|uniref:Uncharacterized protein n=1 Tax=Faunimonas pinastri TaxID=1855383 RepID=A0A1H9MQ76_9HYPH|nr:hypothetical protein [Faunimonas pinastri]SER25864.1 hypothetical protein SAMN05216548_1145 [Faunimonas pinastri]
MASDTKNVKLGVCRVLLAGQDLGYTKGGVDVEVQTQTHEVEVDQFGQSPINEYIMGRTVTAKVPLAETTLDNLVRIMPGATLITDHVDPTKKKVVVTNGIGVSLLELAKELVLHPIALADDDYSEDFVIPKAATSGALQFSYKLDDERVFTVTFKGYPDPDTKTLFTVGDDTAEAA